MANSNHAFLRQTRRQAVMGLLLSRASRRCALSRRVERKERIKSASGPARPRVLAAADVVVQLDAEGHPRATQPQNCAQHVRIPRVQATLSLSLVAFSLHFCPRFVQPVRQRECASASRTGGSSPRCAKAGEKLKADKPSKAIALAKIIVLAFIVVPPCEPCRLSRHSTA